MKIWIINQYAMSPLEAGGTRHYNLGRELVKRGHEVTIVTSTVNYITRKAAHVSNGGVSTRAEIDGVCFIWVSSPTYEGNGVRRVWNMVEFATNTGKSIHEQRLAAPDVILGSSPSMAAALAAARLARSYKVPFVLEVRDLWPQSLVDLGNVTRRHPVVLLLESVEKYLYRRADVILSPLPNAKDHIRSKCPGAVDAVWLPNGVECAAVPLRLPSGSGSPFTLMYAGAHNVANNLETVLEAAAILKEQGYSERIRFRFVGDGPQKSYLLNIAQEKRIHNISFEDQVPKCQIYSVLQQADAFLMSTRKTTLYKYGVSPNKLHDYMAVARPTIVAMDSFNNPVAQAGAGLVVPPERPDELAEAIKEIYGLPPGARNAMGIRGRKFVEENNDFSQLAVRLEHTLKQVADETVTAKLSKAANA